MKTMDAMQQALAAVSAKSEILGEHDLTEPVFLLCEWAAKYHLAQMKAAASAVRPLSPGQPAPVQSTIPASDRMALIAGIARAFEALLAAQKVALGNGY